MERPIPDHAPVAMATLSFSCMASLPIIQQNVEEQRRRPGEENRSEPFAAGGVEVLVEALTPAQVGDGSSQALRALPVAVSLKPVHQEPVYVNPHRPAPVSLLREPVPAHVVARHWRDVLVRQTKPLVLQGVDHTLCPGLVGDARVERSHEVRPEIHAYRAAVGEVVVQVCAASLVPELLVDSPLRLCRQFLVRRGVLADDPRYLREVPVGFRQQRVKEHVLHKEGAVLPNLCLVVASVSEELDQVGEAIICGTCRSVRGGDGVNVGAVVAGYLIRPKVQALHDLVPYRGVVHTALPGMAYVGQPLTPWVSLSVEVPVPRLQFGEGVLEELLCSGFVLGAPVDTNGGRGVDGGLDHPRGLAVFRGIRALIGVPEIGAREVISEAGVEDQLWQETILPLGFEEVPELPRGAPLIVAGVGYGDERRVPRPLVRVETGSRLGVLPGPVIVQHRLGLADQHVVLALLRHSVLPSCRWCLASFKGLEAEYRISPDGTGHLRGAPENRCPRPPSATAVAPRARL